ncbi:MAG TPA: alanine--tRNA ligase, partial [Burkholderiales bacterium]|nr:alanine--tRNA ligase [Burkholderiales bacterium]
MKSSDIRTSFLEYFRSQGHTIVPSSSLVPANDPTLLFVNSGMVQFKETFLGREKRPYVRATTSQRCVRAGGKHNDLENVGYTARHHTFFEMLGNFSFGDYFKKDAIDYAWELLTKVYGLPAERLWTTVYETDDEAYDLWTKRIGVPAARCIRIGDKPGGQKYQSDNFWQMADTGPCGPCSEIFVDLAFLAKDWRFPENTSGEWTDLQRNEFSLDAFVEGAEAGRFLEIWNLVFMQYDRQPDGTLVPLPKPSVDTGMGLERTAAAMQGVTSNYHTDVFRPLLDRAERVVGKKYWGSENASFQVLADHARAVAFLLADGVFPSNEGRGYVLRRILRRAVRHAWLLGRKEPTLVSVVEAVIDSMGDVYPELRQRAKHIVESTRVEEQGFLATIEAGLARFDQIAPVHTANGSRDLHGTISGEDAF